MFTLEPGFFVPFAEVLDLVQGSALCRHNSARFLQRSLKIIVLS